MASDYREGWKAGFNECDDGAIDAYKLSRYSDEYRVGYVIGWGETRYVGAPPNHRYHLIGAMAEEESGIGIALFERCHQLESEEWADFKEGFLGDDDEPFDDDDENFDD